MSEVLSEPARVPAEARRRRTFAVISHPDAGKSTLTEALALYAEVILLDAAKGLEPQTLKLFVVCRSRGIPVLTFVNKWVRPGREALELLDEVEQTIGLRPMPLTWPLGIAGELRGLIEGATGEFPRRSRTRGRAPRGPPPG